MVKLSLAAIFSAGILLGQAPTLQNVTTTETQAVIRYVAPNTSACTVEISESSSLSPLVHDVDPSLFSGANLDSRVGSVSNGTERIFVAGKRDAEKAGDGRRYSRALQANTQHFYQITCGPGSLTGTFRTANPVLGDDYTEIPTFDSTAFGNYGWPSIDWTNQSTSYIDPLTGLLLKRVSFSQANGYVDSPATSGAAITVPESVQDGSDFYTSGTSCPGTNWTNPCAALASDGVYATYSGTASSPIEVSFTRDTYFKGPYTDGPLSNFQITVLGYGTDSSATNRTVNVCLSVHVYMGVCGTGSFPIVLPQGSPGSVTYPAQPDVQTLLASWLDSTHLEPLAAADADTWNSNVTINGTALTYVSGNTFNGHLIAGDHVRIPGSAPACPNNECLISLVNNATSLAIQENLGNFNGGGAVAVSFNNFGAILEKTTATGAVYIDYVNNTQNSESAYGNASYGESYMFSPTTVSVCVDMNGNPVSPCRNAFGFMPPVANSASTWMLFFPDNGEVRYVDPLQPSNVSGVDGYRNAYCRGLSEAFDPASPNKVWCAGIDSTGTNIALVSGTYNYNATNGCDYRNWTGFYSANPASPGNPCVTWTNETPISTGNGMTAKVQQIWPAYDPLYDGGLSVCAISRDGRYMSFYAEQGAAPLMNPQDTFGAALFFDLETKTFVQKFDTYTTWPARFGQMHACPMEYFLGYNEEEMAKYDWVANERGTADYQLAINSISGRSDLSLDPPVTVSSVSTGTPALVTTTIPHQIDPNGNTAIQAILNLRGLYGRYYAKVQSATTFQLYQDAGYTQPVTLPGTTAFQQGLVGAGTLIGGSGCTGTSFSAGPISDQSGTGATIAATITGGVVSSVAITSQGSGYTGPVYAPLTGNSCSGASVVLNPEAWTIQTLYANACPTVSNKWQAMGVTPGSPNCITLNLAADPVKITRAESLGASTSGVHNINILSGGSGYTSPPTIAISGGGGTGAAAAATVSGGAISSLKLTATGSGYSYPRVVFSNSTGCSLCTAAHGSVTTSGGAVTGVVLSGAGPYEPIGGWYTAAPALTFYGPGTGAAGTAVLGTSGELSDVIVTAGGSGYKEAPAVTISGGGGSGAAAIATVANGAVTGIAITNPGSGYTSAPTISITGGYGSGFTATAVVAWPVAGVTITAQGSGYVPPAVTVSGGGGSGAVLTAGLYEEMTAFPYPHNSANCGGDGTTSHCWTQPLTLQEGDAFDFVGESTAVERPFAVQVTHNSDGTVTAVFARFLGPYNASIPPASNGGSYTHKTPIRPAMTPALSGNGLFLVYAQSDTTASNPMPENPETAIHQDFISPVGQPQLDALVTNDGWTQHARIGLPASQIGASYQINTPDPIGFNGSKAQMARWAIQTHPSTRQYAAPLNEIGWDLDMRPLSNYFGGVDNVFQNTTAQVGGCSGTVCLYDVTNPFGVDIKNVPLAVWAAENLLQDKSGPGSVMSLPADVWKYCYSYNAGECVAGSPAGHIYMAVDKAVANGQCGSYYDFNVPCVTSPTPDFSYYVQQGYNRPDLNGNDWRKLTMAFGGWARNQDGFQNMRATPDGSWAITWTPWVEGVANTMFAVKLPPWPVQSPGNMSQFVQIPVPVETVAGMASARIRFGYAENGPPGSFFCTTREEACTTSGTPFAFAAETQADTACGSGCVVDIPAVPRRVVYYEVDGVNSSGQVVSRSPIYVDVADAQLQQLKRRRFKGFSKSGEGNEGDKGKSAPTNIPAGRVTDAGKPGPGEAVSRNATVRTKRWDHSDGHD